MNRVVQGKRKYNLSTDQAEANTARRVLAACPSTQMQFTDPGSTPPPPADTPPPLSGQSCPGNYTEAHAMGMSYMGRDHACYQPKFNRDQDSIACEARKGDIGGRLLPYLEWLSNAPSEHFKCNGDAL